MGSHRNYKAWELHVSYNSAWVRVRVLQYGLTHRNYKAWEIHVSYKRHTAGTWHNTTHLFLFVVNSRSHSATLRSSDHLITALIKQHFAVRFYATKAVILLANPKSQWGQWKLQVVMRHLTVYWCLIIMSLLQARQQLHCWCVLICTLKVVYNARSNTSFDPISRYNK